MIHFFKRYYVALILLATVIVGGINARQLAPTTDEHIHVASAYLALTRGDHRFDPEHPFVFKYLTALPLLLVHPNLPTDDAQLWNAAAPTFYDSWKESREWSDQWLYRSGNDAELIIFLARIPSVLCLALLGYLVYFASRRWFTEQIARWSLLFTVACPTLLAHASLANNDVALALVSFWTIWRLWRYHEEQTWKTALWLGFAFALAITTKFSAIILLPLGLIWVFAACRTSSLKTRALHMLGAAALAIVWIWTSYFWQSPFEASTIPQSQATDEATKILGHVGLTITQAGNFLHYLLPSAFIKGIFLAIGGSIYGRPTFILGSIHALGVWFYFPTLILLKSQLIALALLGMGVGLCIKRIKTWRSWKPVTWLLLLFGVGILLSAVDSKLNLGIRHITQLMPLLAIAMALVLAQFQLIFKHWIWVTLIALVYILPVALQFHTLLGFHNILTGINHDTYLYFNDSNLDWGQQTKDVAIYLENYADTTGTNPVIYANWPWSPYGLEYFGVHRYSYDPTKPPTTGLTIVTATQLAEPEYLRYRDLTPIKVIDDNTFIYANQ